MKFLEKYHEIMERVDFLKKSNIDINIDKNIKSLNSIKLVVELFNPEIGIKEIEGFDTFLSKLEPSIAKLEKDLIKVAKDFSEYYWHWHSSYIYYTKNKELLINGDWLNKDINTLICFGKLNDTLLKVSIDWLSDRFVVKIDNNKLIDNVPEDFRRF
jgi:hypothetical protein